MCDSAALAETGCVRFEIPRPGLRPLPCFAVRKRGRAYAYLNRCMHWPVTLDMETNDFWDFEARFLQCRTHGALYQLDGLCIAGPCTGERLIVLPVVEQEGGVFVDGSRLPAALLDE